MTDQPLFYIVATDIPTGQDVYGRRQTFANEVGFSVLGAIRDREAIYTSPEEASRFTFEEALVELEDICLYHIETTELGNWVRAPRIVSVDAEPRDQNRDARGEVQAERERSIANGALRMNLKESGFETTEPLPDPDGAFFEFTAQGAYAGRCYRVTVVEVGVSGSVRPSSLIPERVHALNMRKAGRPVPKDDRVAGLPDGVYDDPETPEETAYLSVKGSLT